MGAGDRGVGDDGRGRRLHSARFGRAGAGAPPAGVVHVLLGARSIYNIVSSAIFNLGTHVRTTGAAMCDDHK